MTTQAKGIDDYLATQATPDLSLGLLEKNAKALIESLRATALDLGLVCSEFRSVLLPKPLCTQLAKKLAAQLGASPEELEHKLDQQTARKQEQQAHDIANSIDAYYDQPAKEYVLRAHNNSYQSLNEAQFKRELRIHHALSAECIPLRHYSQLDLVLNELQKTKTVDYVGPLAGRDCGYYHENGIAFLVTKSPVIIEPKPGKWKTLETFFSNLYWPKDEPYGDQQKNSLYGWLATAYEALRKRKFREGQAIGLAGPTNAGKCLSQALFTQILGGRSAKASMWLQGRTDFNSDLFAAEHLMLEDEVAETNHRARMALAQSLRNVVSNRLHPCHPKYRIIVTLPSWWRVSISLNDEGERLMILPPLDDDMKEKIILLKASLAAMPMPVATAAQKEKLWQTLVSELPAFLYWLTREFTLPDSWQDPRFGVKAWQHPMLLRQLEELSPSHSLLALIDQLEPWTVLDPWAGPALELRRLLLNTYETQHDARELLSWRNACGTYLHQLSRKHPDRVRLDRTQTQDIYTIFKPIPSP